jgi:Tfp pilus assembly protein PilF
MVALALTAATAIFLFLFRRRFRPAIVSLGAFLLLIFPMLGFTQSGSQLFADRFTYLAAVPLSILLAGGLTELKKMTRMIYGALTAAMILFGVQTFVYASTWSNSLTLWCRAVAVDRTNSRAYNCAGMALMDHQQYAKALEYFEQAIRLSPTDAFARHNRALTLAMLGRNDEAFAEWELALTTPDLPGKVRAKFLVTRGWFFEQTQKPAAAEQDYSTVADDPRADPVQRSGALQLRAALYVRTGRQEKALSDLKTILELPDPFGDRHQTAHDLMKKINPPVAD